MNSPYIPAVKDIQEANTLLNEVVDHTPLQYNLNLSERYEAGFNKEKPAPTLRDAALVLAINRIATVVLQRDIWP